MGHNFDSLIFDLDGTLWNCSAASAEGFNRAYKEFGIEKEISAKEVQAFSGQPSSEYNQILLNGVPQILHAEILKKFVLYEAEALKEMAKDALYQGVKEGLNKLSQIYNLFVVSNCGEEYLNIFMKHTKLQEVFTDAECFERTGKSKAENIKDIIKRNKLHSPCYVGDTDMDEDAATQAGVPFFFAAYGFGKSRQCRVAFKSFGQLVEYFILN